MGIGGSIFLIVVGAILAFAVNVSLWWLDLNVVGWVMILAGVVGLVLSVFFWNNNRRRAEDAPEERRYVREHRTDYRPSDRPM